MDLDTRIKELHGKCISQTRAADLLGISRDKLSRRISALGLDWPKGIPGPGGGTVINGVRDSLERHALSMGMTPGRLAWRLKTKQPLDKPGPVEATPEIAREFTELRRSGVGPKEAAARLGVTYETIRRAAIQHCPDYRDVVKSAPRVRRTKRNVNAARDYPERAVATDANN